MNLHARKLIQTFFTRAFTKKKKERNSEIQKNKTLLQLLTKVIAP